MTNPGTRVDTVIIGAGQAGLAASYLLTQQGREHIIFERATRLAEPWRNRWDSFTLVTPNWTLQLPGFPYQGTDPDGFADRAAVIRYFEDYAASFQPPVHFGTEVTAVEVDPSSTGFSVTTTSGLFTVRNVVVATGLFQRPKLPAVASALPPSIRQFHSSDYRNPRMLPPGAVLVVGSAQSGAQIAEELCQSGRRVYLSVGRAGRLPRRYRGRDVFWWAGKLYANRTVDKLPSPKAKFAPNPHVSGRDGGHPINLHAFARDGVVLLGHLGDTGDGRITLAPDLKENLAAADKAETEFTRAVETYVTENGLDVPEERLPQLRDGFAAPETRELDLAAAGIRSVIWATGYAFDFSFVRVPVFDDDGYPIHRRGVSGHPGLYFLGLPWLHSFDSGLIVGVGDDAAHIAAQIHRQSQQLQRRRESGSQATTLGAGQSGGT